MCYYQEVASNEATKSIVESSYLCSCVQTARSLGAELPKGDADHLQPNSTPKQGGVVILQYGNVTHLAFIHSILKGGMWVQEGNKTACLFTERFIPWDDEHITGFWYG